MSDIPNLQDYKYSTEITESAAFNQVFGVVSKKDLCVEDAAPLLSLIFGREETPRYASVGAVFFSKSISGDKDIICESKTPSLQQLNKPYLQNGEPVCGAGTTEFIVN